MGASNQTYNSDRVHRESRNQNRERDARCPIAEWFPEEVPFEVIGDFVLQVVPALCPFIEKIVHLFELHKEMFGRSYSGVPLESVLRGSINSVGE